jgi:hypothetical protein
MTDRRAVVGADGHCDTGGLGGLLDHLRNGLAKDEPTGRGREHQVEFLTLVDDGVSPRRRCPLLVLTLLVCEQ